MYRVIRVVNTYAWIIATAVSKIVSVAGIIIMVICVAKVIFVIIPLRRDRSRCPATMFAVSRTHRVIGRMRFLVISIITMKFIRGVGVPCGTRCVMTFFVCVVAPNSILVSHMIIAITKFVSSLVVLANVCGSSAAMFMMTIIRNIVVIIFVVPFFLFVIRCFVSVSIILLIFSIIAVVFLLVLEVFVRIIIIGRRIIIHDVLMYADDGSNIENRFVIIFTGVAVFLFLLVSVLFFSFLGTRFCRWLEVLLL